VGRGGDPHADDMLHVRCHGAAGARLPFSQYRDLFFFDFGITVLWGFQKEQEVQVCCSVCCCQPV
jgi:hypothetical protein